MEENKNIEGVNGESPMVNKEIPHDGSELSTFNNQPSTLNLEPLTNMEVHHHPDLHHKRKKFKEYFLEFLMIFLAVTLGFFAESFREHLVERKKEKEYMKNIVQSLAYDSLRCNLNSVTNYRIFAGLDSLRDELKKAVHGEIDGNIIYYLAFQYLGNIGHAAFNTSVITELKNSGSLRLIEDKKIVNALADYYERKLTATEVFLPNRTQVSDLQKTQNEFLSLLYMDDYVKSFDNIIDTTYTTDFNYRNILEHKPALQLLKTDSMSLKRFYTEISQFEIQLKNYNFWLSYDKKAAENLINEIKIAYHLDIE